MGKETSISWCDHTFNPWRGCAKVSPGCDNCYAEQMSHQNPAVLGEWGPDANRVAGAEAYMRLPFRWAKDARAAGVRRRVFCLSLGDWLEDRPDLDAQRLALLSTVERTPELDWLLLTKRPENFGPVLRRCLSRVPASTGRFDDALVLGSDWLCGKPPANVWAGVSVEDREHGLPRVDALRRIPAALRFLSVEPLLEDLGPVNLTGIGWVIVGGESGPGARPFCVGWVRLLMRECEGVAPIFVKQLGSNPHWNAGEPMRGLRDRKGGDPAEWPQDIRRRMFPTPTGAPNAHPQG